MMGWGLGCGGLGRFGHMGVGGIRWLGPLFGLMLLLGLLALLAVGAILLARRSPRVAADTATRSGSSEALDVAKRRMASGEITVEEYHRIRGELHD